MRMKSFSHMIFSCAAIRVPYKHCIHLFILLFFTHCTSGRKADTNEAQERAAITDSTVVIDIERCSVENLPLSRLIKSVTYVELETCDSSFLYAPKQIKLTDSLIYVCDVMQQLKKFDRKGRYLGDAYQRGEGPEELINLYDFDVDEKYLYLLEGNRSILFKFTHHGDLADRIHLPFRAICFKHLQNGDFLFRLAPYSLKKSEKEHVLIIRTDEKFNITGRYFEQSHESEGTTLRAPFFENTNSAKYFAPLFHRSIYELTDKAFYMKYYLEFDMPYYETSRKINGMQEARERGIFYTFHNPIHNAAYIFQPFVTSKDQQGLLIIDRTTDKALFARRIEIDHPHMTDFNMLTAFHTYDEKTGSFVGLSTYYYEDSFVPEDLQRVKEAMPDSLERVLLRKEKEEINPVLMFFRTGEGLTEQ